MKNKTINFTGYRALKSAQILSNYKETDNLIKAHEGDIEKGGEGSRGGKVIGHTKSGKPVYAKFNHPSHKSFTKQDHKEASDLHDKEANKYDEKHRSKGDKQSWEKREYHYEQSDKHDLQMHDMDEEDSKEAHEKRGFNESTGDEDVTGKNEKLKKAYDELGIINKD